MAKRKRGGEVTGVARRAGSLTDLHGSGWKCRGGGHDLRRSRTELPAGFKDCNDTTVPRATPLRQHCLPTAKLATLRHEGFEIETAAVTARILEPWEARCPISSVGRLDGLLLTRFAARGPMPKI